MQGSNARVAVSSPLLSAHFIAICFLLQCLCTFVDSNHDFPENTMSAYKYAAAHSKADAIEIDIWLSRDGVPVVNHDPLLFMHLNSDACVNDLTLAQLQKLKYLRHPVAHGDAASTSSQSSKKGGSSSVQPLEYYESEVMPTLEDVIKLVLAHPRLKLMIEVKEQRSKKQLAAAIVALYKRYPALYERAWVAAFDPRNLYYLRQLDGNIVTAFLCVHNLCTHLIKNVHKMRLSVPFWLRNVLVQRVMDEALYTLGTSPRLLNWLGCNMSALWVQDLNDTLIQRYKEGNIVCSTWTVNSRPQKQYLMSAGVTVISDIQIQSRE